MCIYFFKSNLHFPFILGDFLKSLLFSTRKIIGIVYEFNRCNLENKKMCFVSNLFTK